MDFLTLRFGSDVSAAAWAVFDGDGRMVSQPNMGSLVDAAAAAEGRRVIVLVPGTDVISTETVLPAASGARLRKMLPYSLEDIVADDVDDLFFAVGPRRASGAVAVSIVARDRLAGWLATLDAANLVPYAICSEADGVPDTPGALNIVMTDEQTFARLPDRPPVVFEGMELSALLDVLGQDESASECRHAVVYLDEAAQARNADALQSFPDRFESTDLKLLIEGGWCRLAASLVQQPGVNFLQGAFAPRSDWGEWLLPWRTAAAIMLAVLLIGIVGRGVHYFALHRQDSALTTRLADACQSKFGGSRLDACEAEVHRRLGNRGSAAAATAGFLDVLAVIAKSDQAKSHIEALSYRDQVMNLRVVVPDVPTLNAFVQGFDASKLFEATIESTNPVEGGVEGRVQIKGAGA